MKRKAKRFLSFLLTAVLVFALLPAGTALAAWDGTGVRPAAGAGTPASPFQIVTAENLKWFADEIGDGNIAIHAILMNDIALNSAAGIANWQNWATSAPARTWTPIGDMTYKFVGSFDGQGNTISGVYVNSTADFQGLFGYIGPGASITDLNIAQSYIKGAGSVGGIAGRVAIQSTVSGCASSATVVGTDAGTGGITGYLSQDSAVEDCTNSGSISSSGSAGGVVGANAGTIENAVNTGSVASTSSVSSPGGICGNNDGTISYAYNTGSVVSSGGYSAGGICGYNYGLISSVFATGVVSGATLNGRICGISVSGASIQNAYYLEGATGIGGNAGTGTAVSKSAAQFSSGEVAYLLGSEFGQTRGTDTHPVFRAMGDTNRVYKLTYMSEGAEHAAQYYNAGNTIASAGIAPPASSSGEFTGWDALPTAMPAQDTIVNAVFGAFTKPNITTVSPLPDGFVDVYYSMILQAVGVAPITYSIIGGALPAGLSLNAVTGEISGTPLAAGDTTFTVQAQNGFGNDTQVLTQAVKDDMPGDGTSANPYQIWTAGHLASFAGRVNTGGGTGPIYASLKADIALNDTDNWENWDTTAPANVWAPIGPNMATSFNGVFEGNGHTISGLYCDNSGDCAGLFGVIAGANSVVRNVNIERSYIKGVNYAGGVCGMFTSPQGKLENCSVDAAVSGSLYVGGVCGYFYPAAASILDCLNSGVVAGTQRVGGIAGLNSGTVEGCRNDGAIQGGTGSMLIGGICGSSDGTVRNAYNTGSVYGSNNLGGICGMLGGSPAKTAVLENVYSRGGVSGASNNAAICGATNAYCALSSSYYLNTSAPSGIGYNAASYSTVSNTAAQFASGWVAYRLGAAFGQTLGTDAFPVFRVSNGSNEVYKLTYMNEATLHATQFYNEGNEVSAAGVAEPTKNGRTFSHWEGLPDAMPASDVTVSAVFTILTEVSLLSATADGAAGTATSTKIDLVFSEDIAGLTTDKIAISDGTGSAVKGALSGSGTEWSIALASVAKEGSVTLTVTAPEGYTLTNGTKTVAVYKYNPPPTGEIRIRTNGWTSFWNTITFGLFFKNTADVTITASDNSGDAVKIEYYVTGTELAQSAVGALDDGSWTEEASFSINPNSKVIVYARLTDSSGNKAYINSAGIVVFTDSAAGTAAISFTKSSAEDATANVTLNGNTIAKIMNGAATLASGSDYTVSGGTITFKATYLDSLDADSYTLTVHYNPMGETYIDAADNDAPATTAIVLTVSAADPVPTKTAHVGPQNGTVTSGTAGNVSFAVSTENILDGTYPVSLSAAPAGVTADDVTISSGSGTLTLNTTAGTPNGSYTLTAIIDGTASDSFTLTVDTAPMTDATISPDTGSFDKYAPADVTTTITWNGAAGVIDVQAGGATVGAGNYTVSGNTLTIKEEYLAAQATGSLVLTIEFNAGASAALTIAITDTTPPTINYASRNYDLSAPADVSVTIAWNSASSVTDVVYSVSPDTTLYTLDKSNYIVVGNDLTIKNSFFSDLSLTTGAALDFDINFNTGATAALTVNVVDGYVPGGNADLSSLSVNGTPVRGFDPNDTEYDVELPYGSSSATVSATTSDPKAGYTVSPAPTLPVPGTATVTVTAEDGTPKTYTISFTIGAAPIVTVTNITVTGTGGVSSVQVGNTLQMLADVLPPNAADRNVTWSIEAGSGADINTSGLLTATAEGSVTVRATAQDGSGVYGEKVITVTATPVTTYTVAFKSKGSVYATKTVNAGESIGSANWPANPTRSRYTFGGWFTGESGAGTRFTSATPVNAAITVYAKWKYSGGGGDGSSTPSAPAAPTYNADVKDGNGAETTLPVTVDKDIGSASIDLGFQRLTQGRTVVTIPSIPDVDTYSVGIPVPSLSTNGEQGTLTVETDIGSVAVPSNMLSGAGVSGGKAEITIGRGDKDSLPDDVKNAIGNKPLVRLMLKIDGKQTDWNNPNTPVTVSMPYTPTAEELADPESIVIWYIDGSGNVVTIPNGHYDAAAGMVAFDTTHFSEYSVAYNKVSFNDVAASAWYNKAVSFIAAREITSGTGNGNYSPEAILTRGEFIVLMMRAYGIAPDENPADNFSDAGNTYYTGYLAAAKRLGISAGVGNDMFAPGKEITRQEMFTLLYNALNVIGRSGRMGEQQATPATSLPQGDSGKTLSDFTDNEDIAEWAKDAITFLVETGTVGGGNGALSPLSMTTRAEMAQVLYNLLGK